MPQDAQRDHPPIRTALSGDGNISAPIFMPPDLTSLLKLESHQDVFKSRPVTFEDCKALALAGEQIQREFAMSSFHSSLYGDKTYIERGYDGSGNFRSFEHTGEIFADWPRINTHTHQVLKKKNDQDVIPISVLPSGGSKKLEIGDFLSHVSVIDNGGNLNVASPYGMCLYIGLENPDTVNSSKLTGWTVASGIQKGVQFLENNIDIEGGIGMGPVVELDHKDWQGVNRRFVFVNWDIIKSSASSGISYRGLCFGKDLPILIDELGVQKFVMAPQFDNLHSLYTFESSILKTLI